MPAPPSAMRTPSGSPSGTRAVTQIATSSSSSIASTIADARALLAQHTAKTNHEKISAMMHRTSLQQQQQQQQHSSVPQLQPLLLSQHQQHASLHESKRPFTPSARRLTSTTVSDASSASTRPGSTMSTAHHTPTLHQSPPATALSGTMTAFGGARPTSSRQRTRASPGGEQKQQSSLHSSPAAKQRSNARVPVVATSQQQQQPLSTLSAAFGFSSDLPVTSSGTDTLSSSFGSGGDKPLLLSDYEWCQQNPSGDAHIAQVEDASHSIVLQSHITTTGASSSGAVTVRQRPTSSRARARPVVAKQITQQQQQQQSSQIAAQSIIGASSSSLSQQQPDATAAVAEFDTARASPPIRPTSSASSQRQQRSLDAQQHSPKHATAAASASTHHQRTASQSGVLSRASHRKTGSHVSTMIPCLTPRSLKSHITELKQYGATSTPLTIAVIADAQHCLSSCITAQDTESLCELSAIVLPWSNSSASHSSSDEQQQLSSLHLTMMQRLFATTQSDAQDRVLLPLVDAMITRLSAAMFASQLQLASHCVATLVNLSINAQTCLAMLHDTQCVAKLCWLLKFQTIDNNENHQSKKIQSLQCEILSTLRNLAVPSSADMVFATAASSSAGSAAACVSSSQDENNNSVLHAPPITHICALIIQHSQLPVSAQSYSLLLNAVRCIARLCATTENECTRLALKHSPQLLESFVGCLAHHSTRLALCLRVIYCLGEWTMQEDDETTSGFRQRIGQCQIDNNGGGAGDSTTTDSSNSTTMLQGNAVLMQLLAKCLKRHEKLHRLAAADAAAATSSATVTSGGISSSASLCRDNDELLIKLLRLLANCCIDSQFGCELITKYGTTTLTQLPVLLSSQLSPIHSQSQSENEELVLNALSLLANLSFYHSSSSSSASSSQYEELTSSPLHDDNSSTVEPVFLQQSYTALLKILMHSLFESNPEIIEQSCRCMGNLTRHSAGCRAVQALGIHNVLLTLLEHMNTNVVQSVCGVLINLAADHQGTVPDSTASAQQEQHSTLLSHNAGEGVQQLTHVLLRADADDALRVLVCRVLLNSRAQGVRQLSPSIPTAVRQQLRQALEQWTKETKETHEEIGDLLASL